MIHVQRSLVAFFSGALFAAGLALAGMTQPQKVIAFLDLKHWDSSLLFVMVGAILVHGLTYPLIRKRHHPVLDQHWHVPTRKDIPPRLILGSALFGVGWGLGGYCPGPAISSMGTFEMGPLYFVGSMILGMLIFKKVEPKLGMRE